VDIARSCRCDDGRCARPGLYNCEILDCQRAGTRVADYELSDFEVTTEAFHSDGAESISQDADVESVEHAEGHSAVERSIALGCNADEEIFVTKIRSRSQFPN
jgi:hypothetical protein